MQRLTFPFPSRPWDKILTGKHMNNNPEEVGTLGHLLVTVSISWLAVSWLVHVSWMKLSRNLHQAYLISLAFLFHRPGLANGSKIFLAVTIMRLELACDTMTRNQKEENRHVKGLWIIHACGRLGFLVNVFTMRHRKGSYLITAWWNLRSDPQLWSVCSQRSDHWLETAAGRY